MTLKTKACPEPNPKKPCPELDSGTMTLNHTPNNITTLNTLNPTTKQELCPTCQGLGSFQTNYYSKSITTNCNTCKGFGTLTICTSCQAQVSFTRYGISCGCNSASLKVAA